MFLSVFLRIAFKSSAGDWEKPESEIRNRKTMFIKTFMSDKYPISYEEFRITDTKSQKMNWLKLNLTTKGTKVTQRTRRKSHNY